MNNKRQQLMQQKAEIERQLGNAFVPLFNLFNGEPVKQKASFQQNLVLEYLLCNQSKRDLIWKYFVVCQRLSKDDYPLDHIHCYNMYDWKDETAEEVLEDQVSTWTKEWSDHRKDHFATDTNTVHDVNLSSLLWNTAKYPVTDGGSLKYFLDKTYFRISKSREVIDIGEHTFIQPMYTLQEDGKVVRFIKVVEISPQMVEYQNIGKVPVLEYSISIKLMPDDRIDHSTAMFRFDSKYSKHYQVLGNPMLRAMASHYAEEKDIHNEEYARMRWERLYKCDGRRAHFHILNKDNCMIYNSTSPLTSNIITLQHLSMLVGQEYKDEASLSPIVDYFKIKDNKKILEELEEMIDLSHKRSDSPSAKKRKDGWFTSFASLKLANRMIDTMFGIEPENTLDHQWYAMQGLEPVVIVEEVDVPLTVEELEKIAKKEARKEKQQLARERREQQEATTLAVMQKMAQEKKAKQNTVSVKRHKPSNPNGNRKQRNMLKLLEKHASIDQSESTMN